MASRLRVPRSVILTSALAAAVLAAGCVEPKYPGSQVIGTFAFTADASQNLAPTAQACAFTEMPTAPFDFQGTFSQNPEGDAFFTLESGSLEGVDRDATFDGQVMTSVKTAPRQFVACDCAEIRVEETLRVALVSSSQREQLAAQACPPDPLTGGVPAVGGEVTGPGFTADGSFDAVLACGELLDRVLPDPERCTCAPCEVLYPVTGERR